ncbi:MAG: septum formation initiator family protein [Marmoricola sp.]
MPRPRFTSRMAILVLVLAVLVVSYASSMRAYLQQRAHINDLHASIESSTADIKALEREKRRWRDDAYVQAQARERFGWVLPGETSYQVIGRDGQPLDGVGELSDPSSVARTVPDPWWTKVYGTLEAADHPTQAPVPKTRITPPAPTPSPSG